MQTHGGAAAEAAITAPERVIRASVQVDWNGDGNYDHPLSNLDPFLERVHVNRSLQGSAPEEIILVEGTSVAELQIVLSGEYEGMSLARHFSPYVPQSVFYGKTTIDREVRYVLKVETDEGLVEYPQFIGRIRTISPDRRENTVEITALDFADMMRKPIQLPPYAMSEEHVNYGEEDSQLIRSHWIIDHALRLCDAGPSDKRPTTREELNLALDSLEGVNLWVTGNGSYLPTIGYLDNLNADTFPNPGNPMYHDNGKRHPDLPDGTRPQGFAGVGSPINQRYYTPSDQGIIRYWVADMDRMHVNSVHYAGFTLNTNGPNANAYQTIPDVLMMQVILGRGRYWEIRVGNGVLKCRRVSEASGTGVIEANSPNLTLPTGQDHIDCFLMWDATVASGSRLYMRAGNNSTGWVSFGTVPTSGSNLAIDQIKGRVTIGQALNAENFFYANRQSGTVVANDTDFCYRKPKYPADLDRGLNLLSFIPSSKKQDAWQLIQQVAAAEWASAFWDERGVFRFWSWERMLEKRNEVVRTFSMDQVEGLRLTNSSDSIRNVLAVTTQKKRARGIEVAYSAQDVMEFYVPPMTEKEFVLWKDDVVSPLTFWVPKYDTQDTDDSVGRLWPTWNGDNGPPVHGYCLQYYKPFQGNNLWQEDPYAGDVEVRGYFTADGYLKVRVVNDFDWPIRFASGSGEDSSPAFNLGGTLIKEFSNAVVLYRDEDSIRKYGQRVLELSGEWYQDTVSLNTMFEKLLLRTKEPAPSTDAITVAGDPRLQLGDVIKVVDKQGFAEEIYLQILGIDRSFTLDEGLTDTLTVEVVLPYDAPQQPPPDPTVPVYRTRRNLCPNPSAANNAKDFYQGSGRVTGVTGMPRTTAYQITNNGKGISLPKTNVVPGRTYKMSCYFKSVSTSQNLECHIDWYSRNGYMYSTTNQFFNVGPGQTIRMTCPAAVAPKGAEKGFLVVASQDGTGYINGILYEEGTTELRDYFDGDSPGATWDGAQGNSQSRIVEQIN